MNNLIKTGRTLCCSLLPKLMLIAIFFGTSIGTNAGKSFGANFGSSPAYAPPRSTPLLNLITPRGVKSGGEHTLKFSGARLKDAEQIFFYDSGVSVLEIKPIDANNINVKIKVEPNCRIGEHLAQVRTKNGISDFRSFFIGRLEEVAEKEPNNEITQSQKIEKNVTVTGIVNTEDVDYFQISGKKGERISVEVEALRLGYLFDPAIALLDKNRFEIAVSDDTPLTKQDPYFSVLLPEDGDYFVSIRESSFVGNGLSHYRMHVGNFPRPATVFPLGGKPGEKLNLQFIDAHQEGQPIRAAGKEIQLPAKEEFRPGLFYTDEFGTTPTPMPFRLNNLDNYLEKEPNTKTGDLAKTEPVALPHAFNGVISEPFDLDYYKFSAKKGQTLNVECFARRLGSGLDPVVNIYNDKFKSVIGSDDSRKADSYMQYKVPADGIYYVRCFDHLRRGQADFTYRIEITIASPKLTLGIKRNDRYSQRRQAIAIPQGGRFAVLVEAKRQFFGGEIELLADNLPAGIKMVAPPMMSNSNLMPVVFEAAADAPLSGSLVDFRGKLKKENTNVVGGFENHADFVLGQPNNSLYYSCKADKLPFAVIEKLPFKLEIVQPKVPMVRNGQMSIKVIAHKDKGFDENINIQFPFRTAGVGTTYQIVMPKGKSEINYPLNANSKAQLGKFPMYVIANSNYKGQAWASSQMAELEVAEPFVTASIPRMSITRGESTQLVCKFNQLKPFDGDAKVEILGVPANVTVEPAKTINKETKEIAFTITTNEKSPFGKHGGLFCRLTITKNGEPIVSRAGSAVLQINKPKPKPKPKVAAKKPAAKPAAKPATKPKPAQTAKSVTAAKPAATKPAAKKPVAKPAAAKPAPKPDATKAAKPATKKP